MSVPPNLNGTVLKEAIQINDQPVVTVGNVSTDLSKEYVSSRTDVWGSYIKGIRALPQGIDDITRDLGVDLYERMAFDPEISSLVNTLKAATLSQDVDISPCIKEESDPDYQISKDIHDHFERVLCNLDPPLNTVLDNMLDALFQGNKVAEKVYEEGQDEDAGRLVLKKLSVKHRKVLFFVTDRFGNVLGFLPALVGSFQGNTQIGISLVTPRAEDLILRDKFAVLAFRPKDGDPRGTSILRSVYNAWWLKMQIWPELLKYLAQFGGPGIIGFASPDSRDTHTAQPDGSIFTETPEQVMLGQLEMWRNGAAAAFPPGSLVEIVQAVGNGEAFLKSIDLLDRQMSKGVTGQELATGEGQHQARSASEVHQEILELLIVFIKKTVCDMLVVDVIKPAIALNWGPQFVKHCPGVSLGEVKKQDKAALMAAYVAQGYQGDPSQWIGIDVELNVPPRDPASVAKAITMKDEAHQAAIAPPEPPAMPGGGSRPSGNSPAPKKAA